MPSKPLTTTEDILQSGTLDPEFVEVSKEKPSFDTSSLSIEDLKTIIEASLPSTQKKLAASRPETVLETTHHVKVRDGWLSRTIRVCPATPATVSSPLIVLLFGGGHCIGFPESELLLARRLCIEHNAVIFLPSYRLAPDHPFPHSINDSWDVVQALAAATTRGTDDLVPTFCSPSKSGFIVGGTSAGSNLTAAIAHLARDLPLQPALTGQFLCSGTYMSPEHVPTKYKPHYLSWTQDISAKVMSIDLYQKMRAAFKPNMTSPLWASFDQHDSRDILGEEVKHGHLNLPPAYLQVCGADHSRDDSLLYERVLREECDIPTRLNLYKGWPHCWWAAFPEAEMTLKREQDTVEGIGWLLQVGKKP